MRAALAELGVDLDQLREAEPDAALGNGGLGRLAACFMESMATLGIPAYGYGIRYDHGLFRQVISDGWQQEYPEDWLSFGNPVGVRAARGRATRSASAARSRRRRPAGRHDRHVWHPAETVEAVAYDTPVVGWRGRHVNHAAAVVGARGRPAAARRVQRRATIVGALAAQARADSISQVLYPSDATPAGQELRLRQEYFFVSASLQDLVRRHIAAATATSDSLPDKAAIQLNDTHPAIAVAELMRHPGRCPRHSLGRGVATSPPRPSATPTTRCCPRRWRPGRSRCSSGCCRATCRSST